MGGIEWLWGGKGREGKGREGKGREGKGREGKGRLCGVGGVESSGWVGLSVWSRADSVGGVELWLGLERVVCLDGWGRPVRLVRLFVGMGGSSDWEYGWGEVVGVDGVEILWGG